MQIELSPSVQDLVDQQLATGQFGSPDEMIEQAIGFFVAHGPGNLVVVDAKTGESLRQAELETLIQIGLDDEVVGRVGQLDATDIKRRGRERLAQQSRSQ